MNNEHTDRTLVVYDLDGTLIEMKPIKEQISEFVQAFKYVPKGITWIDSNESLINVRLNSVIFDVVQFTNDSRNENYKVALISNRKKLLYKPIIQLLARLGVDVDYVLLKDGNESKFERLKRIIDGQHFHNIFIYEDDIKQINEYEKHRKYLESLNINYHIYNVNDYVDG